MIERVLLDDAPYASLMTEQLKRCGDYASEWRHTQLSDPGVTLLQLMAVLTDLQGYHADSVTEAHLQRYARLLGIWQQRQKCTKISFTGTPAGKLLRGTPITVEQWVFEYACQINDTYRFLQKDTVADYRQVEVGHEGGAFLLPEYHALNSKDIRLYRYSEGKGAWRQVPTYATAGGKAGLQIRIHAGQPGRYRIVYRTGAPFCVESDGTAGQRIPLSTTGVLPQAFKLWAEEGGYLTDIACHLQEDMIITGNGADYPIPPKGARLWAYQMVLSQGAVKVSRKSRVTGLQGTFSGPFVVDIGAQAETAASALGRFQQGGDAGRLRLVTPDDYREMVCRLTGLPAEKVTVAQQGYAISISLLEDAPIDIPELQRRLSPLKLINQEVRIMKTRKVPLKIRGQVTLTEDHPQMRARFMEALRRILQPYYIRQERITFAALNRAVSALDFVRSARLTAEQDIPNGMEAGGCIMIPEPDAEEVVYG